MEPHVLPLSVSVTVAKQTWVDADLRRASAWALFNVFVFFVSHYALHHYNVPCSKCSFLRCSRLTDAEAAQETALWIVMLCCAAAQTAAAVLALQLPFHRRRVRRALVYLALTLTFVCHCMFAADVCLNLVADPEDLFCWIFYTVAIVFFAVDSCFMTLLRAGEIKEQGII